MSGTGITGGGSGYAAILAHAGVLYGTELGSVALVVISGAFINFLLHNHSVNIK